MKIGLNATCFNERPSGAKHRFVGIYRQLVKQLPEAEFVLYEPKDYQIAYWFEGAQNVTVKSTPLPSEGRVPRFIEGVRYWDKALSQEELDVFEVANLPLVKAPTGKTILTIHDIRGLRPESGLVERSLYKLFFERSLRAAGHVVTVSVSMKNELLDLFPSLPISVIYNGVDPNQFHNILENELKTVRTKYGLPGEFILAVGHFEKRKNYFRLVEAIAQLRDRGRSCELVIIGNNSGEGKKIKDKVESSKLSSSVTMLSGLNDSDVRCIYKLCSLFIFPSSYEGFGIPILEAMAASRPMVLSDIPVFREITQDRGIYFPYDSVELMANAIEKGLSSNSERTKLVEYGNERIKDFSFQSLAAQMGHLYRSLT